MKKELQSIALILFGILLAVVGLSSYSYGIAFGFMGLFVGGLGIVSIFAKEKKSEDN